MYELENPQNLLSTAAIQELELPAELTQNNNFFGNNTSESLPQNVNFANGTDEILLESLRKGTSLSFSEDSRATNKDLLTGSAINLTRESSQSPIPPQSINLALVDSTVFEGSSFETVDSIATDKDGNIYLTGTTTSPNFPITPNAVQKSFGSDADPLQRTFGGSSDAFVAKISSDGTLLYSSYIGGTGNDNGTDIAVDDAGNIYVTGTTNSSDFPTLNPLQNTNRGGQSFGNDVFVTKISADGSNFIYSTYLGGRDEDASYGIAVDSEGNAYITGSTNDSVSSPVQNFGDFPTTENAAQRIFGDEFNRDAFVSKISADGSNLLYSTLLGGSNFERSEDIVLDSNANAYITGVTSSNDFPLANATQNTFGGENDIFVAQLNSDGSEFVYSTFYGGKDVDEATGIALDSVGNIYIGGYTGRAILSDVPVADFPVINAFQGNFGGGDRDGVVVKINSDRSVSYASFLGGEDNDFVSEIAVDATGSAYVVGITNSAIFPSLGEGAEAFVAKVSSNGTNLEDSIMFGGNSIATGESIALDSVGNAYIAGSTATELPATVPRDRFSLIDGFVAKIATLAAEPAIDTFPAFDESVYLAENPGVADAVSAGIFVSGLEHWIENGFSEGRQPQIAFDEDFYLQIYPGVAEAVANGTFANALEHYVFFGAAENRLAVP